MKTQSERFWAKVVKTDSYWLWVGAINSHGYGNFYFSGGREGARFIQAHRFAYGPVAPGLVLDHLCRNPRCVNPAHLEAVSQKVNIHRGTSESARLKRAGVCRRGHEQSVHGYRWNGKTVCRVCQAAAAQVRRDQNRAAYNAYMRHYRATKKVDDHH